MIAKALASMVCAMASPLVALAQNGPDMPLFCEGQNPFWTLEIDRHNAEFQRTGSDARHFNIPLVAIAQGDNDTRAFSLLNQDVADTAIVLIRPATCLDKSQIPHDFGVEILTQEGSEAVLLSGCCRVAQ